MAVSAPASAAQGGTAAAMPSGRPTPAAAPAGESFATSPPADKGMEQIQQARAAATAGPLAQVPTSLIPMGTHTYDASAKVAILTTHVGNATVTRTPSEIGVEAHGMGQDIKVSITADTAHPGHFAVEAGGQHYDATLQPQKGGGFVARTTTGQTLAVTPDGPGFDVAPTGFPDIPSILHKVILKPA